MHAQASTLTHSRVHAQASALVQSYRTLHFLLQGWLYEEVDNLHKYKHNHPHVSIFVGTRTLAQLHTLTQLTHQL